MTAIAKSIEVRKKVLNGLHTTMITRRPPATLLPDQDDRIANCNLTNIIMFSDSFQFLLMFIYLIGGAYILTFGYRTLKQTLFSVAFTLVYSLVYVLLTTFGYIPFYLKTILSISPAILCGKMNMEKPSFGMPVTGFVFGVMLGIVPLLIYSYLGDQAILSYVFGLVIVLSGIAFAYTIRKWRKGPTIVATSVFGSTLVSIVIDYMNNNWTGVMWVFARLQLAPTVAQPCRYSWVTVATWLAFTTLGIIIQFCLTGTTGANQEQNIEEMQNSSPARRCKWSISDCFLPYCSETSRQSGAPSPPYTPAQSLEDAEEDIPLPTLSDRISAWRSRLPGEIERCCEVHPLKPIQCDQCKKLLQYRTMRNQSTCTVHTTERASST